LQAALQREFLKGRLTGLTQAKGKFNEEENLNRKKRVRTIRKRRGRKKTGRGTLYEWLKGTEHEI